MSKKYETLANDIVEKVGGHKNVSTLTHCMTRLRFALNDNTIANRKGMESLEGVINVVESGGQFQVVIGTHVEEVYEEVIKLLPNMESTDNKDSNNKDCKKTKESVLNKVIDFVSGTFSPIVPAIAGVGMIKALLALLVLFNLVSKETQTYYVISFMTDSIFYFLPFLIGASAARKLKCNPYIAMALAAMLLHPNFGSLVTAGEPVHVFGLPLALVRYSSSVVPIILIVWLQSYVEGFMKKITPDAIKLIVVPMVTMLVTGLIGLIALGPIGYFIGEFMASGFKLLNEHASWLVIFTVATFAPLMVMFGVHHSLVPLSTAQITTLGVENILGPGILISNISQGVATLIVAWRTKDKQTKQIAVSGGITSLMGITEPALYGVALPKKYPLIASMIGSACGGLYAGFNNVIRYATGVSGLPAVPLYIGENIWHFYNILIALVIASVVTVIVTYLLSLKYETKAEESAKQVEKTFNEQPQLAIAKDDTVKNTGESIVFSPLKGEIIPLSEVKDAAFASEAMGKGVAIEPSEGKVVAPFDGTVAILFPTKHAIGMVSENGIEVLVHVGLNTVELNGKYFEAHVKQGDKVKKGQVLVTFDLESLRKEGYITQTPVIITNTDNYSNITIAKEEMKIDESTLLTLF